MKRAIAFVLALLLLAGACTALAASPGTPANPLISLSFMEGKLTQTLLSAAENLGSRQLKAALDQRLAKTGDAYDAAAIRAGAYPGYTLSPGYVRAEMPSGGTLTLLTGGSFVLQSGTGTVTVSSGTLLDLTTGTQVPSGSWLAVGSRYFLCESSNAVFTASSDCEALCDGWYKAGSGTLVYDLRLADVTAEDWYYDAAVYARGKGLLHQNEDTFRPYEEMTRAEVIYALWTLAGKPQFSTNRFSDLTESWYIPAVAWASTVGLSDGYDDGTFHPYEAVSREQLAVFLYRFAGYLGRDRSAQKTLNGFNDAYRIADWATTAVRWVTAEEIMTGETVATFCPEDAATRAEAMTAIMNFAKKK